MEYHYKDHMFEYGIHDPLQFQFSYFINQSLPKCYKQIYPNEFFSTLASGHNE